MHEEASYDNETEDRPLLACRDITASEIRTIYSFESCHLVHWPYPCQHVYVHV